MEKANKKQKNGEKPQDAGFKALGKYVRYSPYKLRPVADVVRGKPVTYALNWLTTYKTQRVEAIKKVLESAVANAKDRENIEPSLLVVKDIRIDQGPIRKYFKPGAQGRAKPQRKRMCHISVTVQTINDK
jgi:large subunit ribosomal protein L22